MNLIPFYLQVLTALHEIGAPYMIVGAFGAQRYGLARTTLDVDIIVDLHESHLEPLARRFPLPRYYADVDQMREGMELGIMFNLIDSTSGFKADLVPLSREPEYLEAFRRRVLLEFDDAQGSIFSAWCSRPEDIIIGKLMAWEEGQSAKHPNDIAAMLSFESMGFNKELPIDVALVTRRASRISARTAKLWGELLLRYFTK